MLAATDRSSRMITAAMRPMPLVPTEAVWESSATSPPTSIWSVSSPPASNGLATPTTCFSVATSAKIAWARAISSDEVTRASEWTTAQTRHRPRSPLRTPSLLQFPEFPALAPS